MIRLGLCCIFRSQPIKFRRTTATYLSKLPDKEQKKRLSEICLSNSDNLMKAVTYCHENGIGDFRINSQILPLKTHPEIGYDVRGLPDGEGIIERFKACGEFCRKNNIRTTFHPDQFIILSSPNHIVVERSIADLEYHAEVAEWVNADVINIHAGGVYNDKSSALKRLCQEIDTLSDRVRRRLTLENDDRSYTPKDLLPVCRDMNIPMVYDVHHHRCLQDDISPEKATDMAIETWDREPLFHVSSPIDGWDASNIRNHHDYIDIHDFPKSWLSLDVTVEVEAKAKELAVLKLIKELNKYIKPLEKTANE
jgi:UV DNA damage endonuclease